MSFSEKNISDLREKISSYMSKRRYAHTLGVEECAGEIAKALLPSDEAAIRSAALLHDISKEIPEAEQLLMLRSSGFALTEEDLQTPGVLHSFSAPIVIKRDFPAYATDEILSAVENHTVGNENMSVFEKIVFLSDYIEPNRQYDSSIEVRDFFFDGFYTLSLEEKLKRLDDACLMAVNGAEMALRRMNKKINSRMQRTKNSLLLKKLEN